MADERNVAEGARSFDRPLLIGVLLLTAFGVVMVYSASAVTAFHDKHNSAYFLTRHTIYAAIGLVAMLVMSRIDYRIFLKPFVAWGFLGASFLGLLLCHTGIGVTLNGASRWIDAGPITIQPAEAMKIALVLWLAYSLARKTEHIKSFSIGFLPHLLVPGVVILACLLQPDFGTAVVIALLTFSLLFVAGAKLGYIMLAGILGSMVTYFLVTGSEYRLKRWIAYLDPLSQSNRFGDGYQLSQSLFGFGEGGLTGTGVGDGLQKLLFLPEAYNDFIASIIGEELGVIGIFVMLAVFAFVVWRGVLVAMRARDEFGTYVALGLSTLIGLQALANMGVAMGLLPTKGLTLPFVSYGGTSLVFALAAVGVLLSISRGANAKASDARDETWVSRHNAKRHEGGQEGVVG
ncbi:MAG: putative lipid II flippase FtsW [Proteobacteria bacterium]|jgi:cell division protein FtsW|nr:putative lipid II flippase FtsW [Pseudomonadota bacterium]